MFSRKRSIVLTFVGVLVMMLLGGYFLQAPGSLQLRGQMPEEKGACCRMGQCGDERWGNKVDCEKDKMDGGKPGIWYPGGRCVRVEGQPPQCPSVPVTSSVAQNESSSSASFSTSLQVLGAGGGPPPEPEQPDMTYICRPCLTANPCEQLPIAEAQDIAENVEGARAQVECSSKQEDKDKVGIFCPPMGDPSCPSPPKTPPPEKFWCVLSRGCVKLSQKKIDECNQRVIDVHGCTTKNPQPGKCNSPFVEDQIKGILEEAIDAEGKVAALKVVYPDAKFFLGCNAQDASVARFCTDCPMSINAPEGYATKGMCVIKNQWCFPLVTAGGFVGAPNFYACLTSAGPKNLPPMCVINNQPNYVCTKVGQCTKTLHNITPSMQQHNTVTYGYPSEAECQKDKAHCVVDNYAYTQWITGGGKGGGTGGQKSSAPKPKPKPGVVPQVKVEVHPVKVVAPQEKVVVHPVKVAPDLSVDYLETKGNHKIPTVMAFPTTRILMTIMTAFQIPAIPTMTMTAFPTQRILTKGGNRVVRDLSGGSLVVCLEDSLVEKVVAQPVKVEKVEVPQDRVEVHPVKVAQDLLGDSLMVCLGDSLVENLREKQGLLL